MKVSVMTVLHRKALEKAILEYLDRRNYTEGDPILITRITGLPKEVHVSFTKDAPKEAADAE